jgi:hypothetical protein
MSAEVSLWKGYLARCHGIGWQRCFFDHRIRNKDQWDEKAAYIRQNPIRAGLVTEIKNWPYIWEAAEFSRMESIQDQGHLVRTGDLVCPDGRAARPYLRRSEGEPPSMSRE